MRDGLPVLGGIGSCHNRGPFQLAHDYVGALANQVAPQVRSGSKETLLNQHPVEPLLIGWRVSDRHDTAVPNEAGQQLPIHRQQ